MMVLMAVRLIAFGAFSGRRVAADPRSHGVEDPFLFLRIFTSAPSRCRPSSRR